MDAIDKVVIRIDIMKALVVTSYSILLKQGGPNAQYQEI